MGDPIVSTDKRARGNPRECKIPWPPALRAMPAGAKRACNGWYRQTKETKCGGKDDRESQRPDSTGEAGEPDLRGPGGGKRGVW